MKRLFGIGFEPKTTYLWRLVMFGAGLAAIDVLASLIPPSTWVRDATWDYRFYVIGISFISCFWFLVIPLFLYRLADQYSTRETRVLQNTTITIFGLCAISIVLWFSFLFWSSSQRHPMSICTITSSGCERLSHVDGLYFVTVTITTSAVNEIRVDSQLLRLLVVIQTVTAFFLLVVGVGVGIVRVAGLRRSEGASPAPATGEPTLTHIDVNPISASIAQESDLAYRVVGGFSDGTTRDITAEVTWESTDPGVAGITSGGVATGLEPGTTRIVVTVPKMTASLTVVAAPPPPPEASVPS
jgi:hypothetical protein